MERTRKPKNQEKKVERITNSKNREKKWKNGENEKNVTLLCLYGAEDEEKTRKQWSITLSLFIVSLREPLCGFTDIVLCNES